MFKRVVVTIGTMWMLTSGTAWAQQLSLGSGSFGYDEAAGVAAEAVPEKADANREGFVPAWAQPKRPGALPVLYASLGVMQALDVYTTSKALKLGARERNPMVAQLAGNTGTMIAYKAAMTAGTIVAVERLWKKNRVGAVMVALVVNGVTAAVAARNVRVANAQRAR